MNMGRDTAEADIAGIIGPAQEHIIHPPNLWGITDGNVDADGIEVLEIRTQSNWSEDTVLETWAGRNGDGLGDNGCGVSSATIIAEAREVEIAGRSLGVTTEGSTINIEREATSETMITISDITRVSELESVGSSSGVGSVHIEHGNELCEER